MDPADEQELADNVLDVVDALRALLASGLAGLPAARDVEPTTGAEPVLAPAIVRPPALRPAAGPDPALAPAIVRPPPLLPDAGVPSASPSAPVSGPAVGAPPPAAAATAPAPAEAAERSVPVGLERLDGLVSLTGEAVAAQLQLTHLLREHIAGDAAAQAAALRLRRALSGVQGATMRMRMTPLESIAGNLHRVARDVARATGKEVDYSLSGERVELDCAVLDGLRDPLLHLVRNAVAHGLEAPAVREAGGKPRRGTVTVTAERRGPEILLTVADDGGGLDLDALRAAAGEPGLNDRDAAALVFRAGLSTVGAVTDVSGRGVGLDAVRTAVEHLRGRVDVHTITGAGCRFVVAVPLTLAVMACVMVEASGQRYHVPTHATVAIVGDGAAATVALEGGAALWVAEEIVPLSSLATVIGGPGDAAHAGPAVVLEGAGGLRHAFQVDAALGQRHVTVKELRGVIPRSRLVAGASVEADGTVVLVLDASALVEEAGGRRSRSPTPTQAPPAVPIP